jgi:hypothetical protein
MGPTAALRSKCGWTTARSACACSRKDRAYRVGAVERADPGELISPQRDAQEATRRVLDGDDATHRLGHQRLPGGAQRAHSHAERADQIQRRAAFFLQPNSLATGCAPPSTTE